MENCSEGGEEGRRHKQGKQEAVSRYLACNSMADYSLKLGLEW